MIHASPDDAKMPANEHNCQKYPRRTRYTEGISDRELQTKDYLLEVEEVKVNVKKKTHWGFLTVSASLNHHTSLTRTRT